MTYLLNEISINCDTTAWNFHSLLLWAIHTYMHACTHMHACIYVNIKYICTYAFRHTCMYKFMYACMHEYSHIVIACMHAHIQTCMHIHLVKSIFSIRLVLISAISWLGKLENFMVQIYLFYSIWRSFRPAIVATYLELCVPEETKIASMWQDKRLAILNWIT